MCCQKLVDGDKQADLTEFFNVKMRGKDITIKDTDNFHRDSLRYVPGTSTWNPPINGCSKQMIRQIAFHYICGYQCSFKGVYYI